MNMVVISLKKIEVDEIIANTFKSIENLPNKKKKLNIPAITYAILEKLDGKGDLFSKQLGFPDMRALYNVYYNNRIKK